MPRPPTTIPLSRAMQLWRVRSRNTLFDWERRGWISLKKRGERWHVLTAGLRDAKVLTVGKAAKMAGCCEKTVRQRIATGLVRPRPPGGSRAPRGGTPAVRLSLADVSTIRGSLQRRRKRRPAATRQARSNAQPRVPPPQLYEESNGALLLRYLGRWWRPNAGPGNGRPPTE